VKLVKMLSLAAVAAIAAMAFVGTSSAFAGKAVLLCKNKELVCLNPWKDEGEKALTATGVATNPKLLSSIGTVECEKSEAVISILQLELKVLQLGHILKLTFTGNCHLGGTNCTVTVGIENKGGGVTITHGPNPLEWIEIPTSLNGVETEATVKCGFLINCTYIAGEETETVATNSATGEVTVTANEAQLKRFKGFCPETSKWDAVYKDTMTGLWLES
jgi:hypothetical protein